MIQRYKTKFKLIDETYNANPFSVKNSIKNLSKTNNYNSKKYILISDMLELGKKSDFYHKDSAKLMLSRIQNETSIKNLQIIRLSKTKYRLLLGPFDADPEKNILSAQSKLAQKIINKNLNDKIVINETDWVISEIASVL